MWIRQNKNIIIKLKFNFAKLDTEYQGSLCQLYEVLMQCYYVNAVGQEVSESSLIKLVRIQL